MTSTTLTSRSRLAGSLTIIAVAALVVGMTIALTQPSPALAHHEPVYHSCHHPISDEGSGQLGLPGGILHNDC